MINIFVCPFPPALAPLTHTIQAIVGPHFMTQDIKLDSTDDGRKISGPHEKLRGLLKTFDQRYF